MASQKGFYLYCLREKSPVSIKVVKTVDKGKPLLLPYKEIEAVASEVDLKKFGSEEIQRKAQEDLNWIKEKAQIHEHVIEQAMGAGGKIVPVVPMRFGTIFESRESLKESLKKNYAPFKKTLERLRGKQEWGVKVYLNEGVFEKQLEKKSEAVARKKEEIASQPKGVDFFAKKQMDEMIKRERSKELQRVIQEIFEILEKPAIEASRGKNLDKAITGRKEPMVLNANFLIKEEGVGGFQQGVERLKAKYQSQGLEIQESGPWPPYNFVG